ncbi:MAG: hypothetical protein U0900_07475 [Myxococcota bacterium]
MVNLLGRHGRPADPPRFDGPSLARIGARLPVLLGLRDAGALAAVARRAEALAAALEELDAEPTRLAAEALLEAVDGLRAGAARAAGTVHGVDPSAAASAAPRPPHDLEGGFLAHRPGRSLATGEAEIASRGYFDACDRPPLATWLGLLDSTSAGFEGGLWIVAWVAERDVERARAGCRACPNEAIAWLDDVSPAAAEQLREGLSCPGRVG